MSNAMQRMSADVLVHSIQIIYLRATGGEVGVRLYENWEIVKTHKG